MMPYGYGPPMRQETPIFGAGSVTVTTARFVVGQQTYPIGAITSVSPFTVFADKNGPTLAACWCALWAVIWLVVGIAGASGGSIVGCVLSIGLTAACVSWVRSRKDSYGVMITTSGMQVRAVISPDQAYVYAIVGALNQALSMR